MSTNKDTIMTDQEIDDIWSKESGEDCIPSIAHRFARAILSRAIPDGHVVVPKEPTTNMHIAGYESYRGSMYQGEWINGIYRAMIAAAPANKEG